MNSKVCFTFAASWLLFACLVKSHSTTFDVFHYGAKVGGSDISKALTKAWKDACASTSPSKVLIPKGTYALRKVEFVGQCKSPIHLQVEGTLIAPSDTSETDFTSWITFSNIDQLTISGGGTFDGQGYMAWKKHVCHKNFYCPKLPYNLNFNFVTNSTIRDVTVSNSKNFHVNIFGCNNVTFSDMTVFAPRTSVNSDGIHITKSKFINVIGSTIKTGENCISIGDGTAELNITRVTCGSGHGITVGSLGMNREEEPVRGVYVKNCTFIDTENGVIIKTWPGSHVGLVTEIHVEDIIVQNVGTPVVIDQRYCPWNLCNLQFPSKIKITNSSFKNIRGTSQYVEAIKFDCSIMFPCQDIEVGDIDIRFTGKNGTAKATCSNVKPVISGKQKPQLCTAPALPFGAVSL